MKLSIVVADASAPSSTFVVWRGFEGSTRENNPLLGAKNCLFLLQG